MASKKTKIGPFRVYHLHDFFNSFYVKAPNKRQALKFANKIKELMEDRYGMKICRLDGYPLAQHEDLSLFLENVMVVRKVFEWGSILADSNDGVLGFWSAAKGDSMSKKTF